MTPILQVKNLSVMLDGRAFIEGITFAILPGESVAVVGPNGAGKTTMVRALLGLIPCQGAVAWRPDVRIGYVPQRIDLERNLPVTLDDFLRAKTVIAGQPAGEIDRVRQLALLDKITLAQPLSRLSTGQFQRAAIAFALMGAPNVLILDEPTSSIDLPGEEEIYDTIHRLQDLEQLTVLIVSHDLNLVYRQAAKVLCLNRRLICYGTPQEILTAEQLRKVFGNRTFYHHLHE